MFSLFFVTEVHSRFRFMQLQSMNAWISELSCQSWCEAKGACVLEAGKHLLHGPSTCPGINAAMDVVYTCTSGLNIFHWFPKDPVSSAQMSLEIKRGPNWWLNSLNLKIRHWFKQNHFFGPKISERHQPPFSCWGLNQFCFLFRARNLVLLIFEWRFPGIKRPHCSDSTTLLRLTYIPCKIKEITLAENKLIFKCFNSRFSLFGEKNSRRSEWCRKCPVGRRKHKEGSFAKSKKQRRQGKSSRNVSALMDTCRTTAFPPQHLQKTKRISIVVQQNKVGQSVLQAQVQIRAHKGTMHIALPSRHFLSAIQLELGPNWTRKRAQGGFGCKKKAQSAMFFCFCFFPGQCWCRQFSSSCWVTVTTETESLEPSRSITTSDTIMTHLR